MPQSPKNSTTNDSGEMLVEGEHTCDHGKGLPGRRSPASSDLVRCCSFRCGMPFARLMEFVEFVSGFAARRVALQWKASHGRILRLVLVPCVAGETTNVSLEDRAYRARSTKGRLQLSRPLFGLFFGPSSVLCSGRHR